MVVAEGEFRGGVFGELGDRLRRGEVGGMVAAVSERL